MAKRYQNEFYQPSHGDLQKGGDWGNARIALRPMWPGEAEARKRKASEASNRPPSLLQQNVDSASGLLQHAYGQNPEDAARRAREEGLATQYGLMDAINNPNVGNPNALRSAIGIGGQLSAGIENAYRSADESRSAGIMDATQFLNRERGALARGSGRSTTVGGGGHVGRRGKTFKERGLSGYSGLDSTDSRKGKTAGIYDTRNALHRSDRIRDKLNGGL